MRCKQIKKDGTQCKNPSHYGCRTCRYHGARRIRYGVEAPNYRHGEYTKEVIEQSREVRARLGFLQRLGEKVGILPKKRGRKLGY